MERSEIYVEIAPLNKNNNMQIIDYIDFKTIFEEIKKNQLEEYPKAGDYIKYLKDNEEPFHYVEEMYKSFEHKIENPDYPCSDNSLDIEIIDLKNNLLHIELFVGGNNATENGDNFWGYGFNYTVDLETELFIGYHFENYS